MPIAAGGVGLLALLGWLFVRGRRRQDDGGEEALVAVPAAEAEDVAESGAATKTAAAAAADEPILAEPDGAVTTVLLSGVSYVKDNRLLPRGFDKATADSHVAVHGAAERDADFVGGSDRVRYSAAAGNARPPANGGDCPGGYSNAKPSR